LIELVDRGSGIDPDDLSLVLERYATSKIIDEHDLFNLSSYGFRGEALASIAEVARVTIQTKQEGSDIGYQITKDGDTVVCNQCVIGFDHGTIVRVEDLFHTIPVRQKFLKSEQTEAKYIIDYVLNVALLHREKHFVIERNGKIIYDLKPMDTLIHRVEQIYKKDRSTHLIECEYTGQQMAVS
jgi:DNA mismatch repair protein MutL